MCVCVCVCVCVCEREREKELLPSCVRFGTLDIEEGKLNKEADHRKSNRKSR